jgi:hypothetical protein
MRWALFLSFITFSLPVLHAETLPKQKQAPRRMLHTPEVILEESETMEECAPEKICVRGQILNDGGVVAENVMLRVEIGGTKYTKPRISYEEKLETNTMNPGDRQEFHIEIERKLPYKDKKEMKTIEVGRFNYKIVPTWKGWPGEERKPAKRSPRKALPKKK